MNELPIERIPDDICELCGMKLSIHSVHITKVRINGEIGQRATGWDCPRSEIGCWPPVEPGTFDLKEPGMFCSDDRTVINWNGETYYQSCNEIVMVFPGGATSGCTKRSGHPGDIHEDYYGRTKNERDLELSGKSLEQAVFETLGAVSTCWDNMSGTGVFHSERAKNYGDQLMERIRQAGPIYS